MRDLSGLKAQGFDLVYQAPSISYVPDVRVVNAQVARVQRSDGTYRVGLSNPATQFVDMEDWDGDGYRIRVPYAVRRVEREGRDAADLRPFLGDILAG